MSMSTQVRGFKPPGKKWKEMQTIYNACKEAKVQIPKKVLEYFDYEDPDPAGIEVTLLLVPYNEESRDGFELKVSEIPEGVEIIRFWNSY